MRKSKNNNSRLHFWQTAVLYNGDNKKDVIAVILKKS